MAWRYPARSPEADGAVLAEDWNRSFEAFAGEINGGMDKDNFDEALFTAAHILKGTFTSTFDSTNEGSYGSGTDITFTPIDVAWRTTGSSGGSLPSVSTILDVDSQVTVELGLGYVWNNVATLVTTTALSVSVGARMDATCVMFRVTVNGEQICISSWHSMWRERHGLFLCGSTSVPQGPLEVRVQCRIAAVNWDSDTDQEQIKNADNADTLNVLARSLVVTAKKR